MNSVNRLFISLLFVVSSVSVAGTKCDSFLGGCDYYKCIELEQHCGEKGYYLNFGYHYCEKYLAKTSKFSQKGQNFLKKIRSCLQHKLEELAVLPICKDVKALAIKTHEECYSENNFCDLKLVDRLRIEWIAKKEILDPKFAQFANFLSELCYPGSTKPNSFEN